MSPVRPSNGESLQEMIDRYNRELLRMGRLGQPPAPPAPTPHTPPPQPISPPVQSKPPALHYQPRPEPDEPLYLSDSILPRPFPIEPLDAPAPPYFTPSMGARSTDAEVEQGLRDREQGMEDIEQGLRDREQGLKDMEQAARDRKQGMMDIAQGLRDREQGIKDMEQAARDRKQGMMDIAQGLRDREQGIKDMEQAARDHRQGMMDAEQGNATQKYWPSHGQHSPMIPTAVPPASSYPMPTPAPVPVSPTIPGRVTAQQSQPSPSGDSFGTLIVQVYTARRAEPVAGAQVAVTMPSVNGEVLYRVMVTDEDGRTPPLRLPVTGTANGAPVYSSPFVNYTVYASADRFQPSIPLTAQIFPGVTSILPVELIPGEQVMY